MIRTLAQIQSLLSGEVNAEGNRSDSNKSVSPFTLLRDVIDSLAAIIPAIGIKEVLKAIDINIAIPKRPVANPPGEGTEGGFPTLDFDDTTEESIFLSFELPHDYKTAGMIHLHFHFFVDTAPAGASNAGWGVEYKNISHDDNFDFSGGTTTEEAATSITTGTPANDKRIHVTTALEFVVTGWIPGDTVFCRIYRNTGVANDFTGDIRVIGDFHIEYISDKLGEPV